jgi:hypothetical protein
MELIVGHFAIRAKLVDARVHAILVAGELALPGLNVPRSFSEQFKNRAAFGRMWVIRHSRVRERAGDGETQRGPHLG